MERKTLKPAWWILFVLLLGMLGLLFLESQDGAPPGLHEILELLIIIAFFISLVIWVRANATALEEEDLHDYIGTLQIHEYPPTQSLSDSQKENR